MIDPIAHKFINWKTLAGVFALLVLISSSAFAQAPPPAFTTLKINSAVLGEERTILVRVPDGYEVNKLRYPVIYMTDGNAHIGHTSSTVEFLARNGRMSEMIVVGINNTDRTRDLSPTHVTTTVRGGSTVSDAFFSCVKANEAVKINMMIAMICFMCLLLLSVTAELLCCFYSSLPALHPAFAGLPASTQVPLHFALRSSTLPLR